MFRFTWDGPEALRKHIRPTKTPEKQRVYRWENKWGLFSPQSGHWAAEKRLPVAHAQRDGTRFLLETVESLRDESPPYAVDDVWEEEVVMNGALTAGISMSLHGTPNEILGWCSKNGILVPPTIAVFLNARPTE